MEWCRDGHAVSFDRGDRTLMDWQAAVLIYLTIGVIVTEYGRREVRTVLGYLFAITLWFPIAMFILWGTKRG